MEERRDIKGYEGRYQISNMGNCRSFCYNRWGLKDTPRTLKKRYNKKNGSYMFNLGRREEELAYRLVAEAFLGLDRKEKGLCVCHKDDDRLNNSVDNLYIGNQKSNIMDCFKKDRHPLKKLSFIDVLLIKRLYADGIRPYIIADFFNMSRSHISRIGKHYSEEHILNY